MSNHGICILIHIPGDCVYDYVSHRQLQRDTLGFVLELNIIGNVYCAVVVDEYSDK